jgi:hypothetical protein
MVVLRTDAPNLARLTRVYAVYSRLSLKQILNFFLKFRTPVALVRDYRLAENEKNRTTRFWGAVTHVNLHGATVLTGGSHQVQ